MTTEHSASSLPFIPSFFTDPQKSRIFWHGLKRPLVVTRLLSDELRSEATTASPEEVAAEAEKILTVSASGLLLIENVRTLISFQQQALHLQPIPTVLDNLIRSSENYLGRKVQLSFGTIQVLSDQLYGPLFFANVFAVFLQLTDQNMHITTQQSAEHQLVLKISGEATKHLKVVIDDTNVENELYSLESPLQFETTLSFVIMKILALQHNWSCSFSIEHQVSMTITLPML